MFAQLRIVVPNTRQIACLGWHGPDTILGGCTSDRLGETLRPTCVR